MTMGGLLERAATSDRGVRFLDRHERVEFLSYAELNVRARQAGLALQALGVESDDRVAIILPTCPAFYDAFFGCASIGAVPVPLYPPVRLGRLDEYCELTASLLRGCGVRLVLTDARTSRVLGRAVAAAGPALGLVTMSDLRKNGRKAGAESEAATPPDPNRVAFIQHSSGTTGKPRPVRLTHRALLANIDAIRARILAAHPETADVRHVAVSWLPLYHDMGLIGSVLTALAHPADLVLIPPEVFVARPAIWLQTLSRYGGTVSGAPNFAYSYCAERIDPHEIEGLDLSRWKVALSGAEPVTVDALDRFAGRFAATGFRREALTPVYGLAEATLAVTFYDPARPYRALPFERAGLVAEGVARVATADEQTTTAAVQLVSLGCPLEGVDVRIVGEDGASVAEGVLGRVHVSGPSMFDGYDDEPPVDPCHWFDTGDTGFLRDGELYLYGRAKDVIIVRGLKYAPQEIEASLDDLPGLRRGCVAALGVPIEEGGEEGLVVLAERTRGGSAAADGALVLAIRGRVNETSGLTPSRVLILAPGTLPRTSSGKIRRAEARRRSCDGDLVPPDRVGAVSLAVEMVRSRLALARSKNAGLDDARLDDS